MDCKGVVDAFHSLRLDVSEFGCLLEDCRTLASLCENLPLWFVYRQAKAVAHALARAVRSHASPSICLEAPSFLVDALASDCFSN